MPAWLLLSFAVRQTVLLFLATFPQQAESSPNDALGFQQGRSIMAQSYCCLWGRHIACLGPLSALQHPLTQLTTWARWPKHLEAVKLQEFGVCNSKPCCSHRNTLDPSHNSGVNCWVSEARCFNLHDLQWCWWRKLAKNHSHRCFFMKSRGHNPWSIISKVTSDYVASPLMGIALQKTKFQLLRT